MPSASAKLEKQASTETADPIKQGITIIEHKIRNLEKRKSRLEGYRDQQASGKELNSDQLAAVAKYDEVVQTLDFARELCKQFHGIVAECAKTQKKQARKEALEKSQQEMAKVKEILLIQDVLANMGPDNVREDFLAGRNGAVKLTEEDLQHLDDLFTEVSPKREIEEGCPAFSEQIQKAAEHLIYLAEGKNKDVIGTTYASLRQKIQEIHLCGYFDSSSAVVPAPDTITDAAGVAPEEEDVELEDLDEVESVPTTTFQSSKAPVQMAPVFNESNEQAVQSSTKVIIPPPQQPPVSEVISSVVMSVASSSFHFLQDSELDSPEVVAPTAPAPSTLPIPSQTFTNQSFVPPPQSYPQQQQTIPQPQQTPQPQPVYAAIPIPTQQTPYVPFTAPPPPQPQHQSNYQHQPQVQAPQQQQISQPVERVSEWSDTTASSGNVIDNPDWNSQCEAASAENAWAQKHQQQPSDSWAMNDSSGGGHHGNNDGFILSTSGRGGGRSGRGGRGGSKGGPRGGGRNQTGGGGGYYRNNNSGGNDNAGNNNYYQSNGFQNRNMSGDHKRGYSGAGGSRGGPGGPRSERGGPRGGSNRGGRGSNRQ